MDTLISAAINPASEIFIERLRGLPPEDRRRLAALEGVVKELNRVLARYGSQHRRRRPDHGVGEAAEGLAA